MDTPDWKLRCSLLADCVSEWRLLPRALVVGYAWFVYELTYTLLDWYMALPAAERGMEASGMAVGIFSAATGFGAAVFNLYMKSERRHGDST